MKWDFVSQPSGLLRKAWEGVKQMAGKFSATAIAWVVIATALLAIWLLWQGPAASPGWTPWARIVAGLLVMLGLFVAVAILLQSCAEKVRRRLAWIIGVAGALAFITLWYSSSVLSVSPTSARIPKGAVLPLTARPMTVVERLRGEQLVQWWSSDSSIASISVGKDPVTGRHVAVVKGMAAGRATIFAVRGTARSEARISVDSLGVIPPRCGNEMPVVSADTLNRSASVDSASGAKPLPPRQPVSRELCVFGSITSPGGQPMRRAKVSLKAMTLEGDTLWSQYTLTDPVDGRYRFRFPSFADQSTNLLYLAVHQQVGEINPVWFIPTQWGLDTAMRVLDTHLLESGVYGDGIDIKLQYSSQSAFSILLLLFPAIFAMLSTVLYYSAYRPDTVITAVAGDVNRERFFVRNYVFANVLIWGALLAVFAALYTYRSVQTISLFSDRLAIPLVAPTFAFLGVLVYAIYVLAEEYLKRLRANNAPQVLERQHILLGLGNRIVIAPYVAIVAVIALFDDLNSPIIPFVAFFTGVWIEAVLGTLKEVGDRFVRRPEKPEERETPEGRDTPEHVPPDTVGEVTNWIEENKEDITAVSPRVQSISVERRLDAATKKPVPVVAIVVSAPNEGDLSDAAIAETVRASFPSSWASHVQVEVRAVAM